MPKYESTPDTVLPGTDATWQDWEDAVHWNKETIPGILVEEDTVPIPLELLPMDEQ